MINFEGDGDGDERGRRGRNKNLVGKIYLDIFILKFIGMMMLRMIDYIKYLKISHPQNLL